MQNQGCPTSLVVVQNPPQQSNPRMRNIVLGIIVGIVAISIITYIADIFLTKDRIPRGIGVAGVNISNMTKAEAEQALVENLGASLSNPVVIRAGTQQTTIDPVIAGLDVDWRATIDGVGEQSLNPFTRLVSIFRTTQVPLASTADKARLDPVLDQALVALHREPVSGRVWLENAKVNMDKSVEGQRVDRSDLETEVVGDWLDAQGVGVEPITVDAPISQNTLDDLAADPAKKAISAPFIVHGRDKVDGVIPPERMGEVVTFPVENDEIRTDVNRQAAQSIALDALSATEQKAQNAKIKFASGAKVVTPEVNGTKINWDATFEDIEDHIIGTKAREIDAIYQDAPATFTAAQAQTATFNEMMGEFTTGGFEAASGKNIALTAQMVDQAVVAPGDTFSLNGYTGPRGSAQGFVKSGIIIDGRSGTAVGGGISQFATTLYNAYYFAGLEDVVHTPHSYYIPRYPAGREATVYEGVIDLSFRNDYPYPVMIQTSADASNVTVRIMGQKTRKVQSINNGRWAQTSPQEKKVPREGCSPSGGSPGFTTSDTRVISDLSGNEIRRETTTTKYDPEPIVRCG